MKSVQNKWNYTSKFSPYLSLSFSYPNTIHTSHIRARRVLWRVYTCERVWKHHTIHVPDPKIKRRYCFTKTNSLMLVEPEGDTTSSGPVVCVRAGVAVAGVVGGWGCDVGVIG